MQKIIISALCVVFLSSFCSESSRSGITPRKQNCLAYWLYGQDSKLTQMRQEASETLQMLRDTTERVEKITQKVDEMNESATNVHNEIQQMLNEHSDKQ